MQKKLLPDLINDLEQEMLRLNYTEGSMRFYRRRWRMLLQFAREREETFYSERLLKCWNYKNWQPCIVTER